MPTPVFILLEMGAIVERDLATRTGYITCRTQSKGNCRVPGLKIIKDFKAVATER